MTSDIEQKALALLNEVSREMGLGTVRKLEMDMTGERALLRAIEQHETYKRAVSDAVEAAINDPDIGPLKALERFIIPKPVDPLVDITETAMQRYYDQDHNFRALGHFIREVMAERNLQITEIDRD